MIINGNDRFFASDEPLTLEKALQLIQLIDEQVLFVVIPMDSVLSPLGTF